MKTEVLELDNIHAGYGDMKVLHGVSMKIYQTEITAWVGSNGAGKSTLLKTIAGLLPIETVNIAYQRKEITGSSSAERIEAGIALVPEGRQIFYDFTVEENLLIGGFTPRVRRQHSHRLEQLYHQYPILRERRRQLGGTLSGGQQQLLAIARGLMSQPALLLLDEPSLGLSPHAVADLFEMILEIRRSGVTVLLIEQNVRKTLEIADHAFVLELGEIVISAGASELLTNEMVRRAYLGL
jgi:branched-chain amino acid transport system ATP-binding protein